MFSRLTSKQKQHQIIVKKKTTSDSSTMSEGSFRKQMNLMSRSTTSKSRFTKSSTKVGPSDTSNRSFSAGARRSFTFNDDIAKKLHVVNTQSNDLSSDRKDKTFEWRNEQDIEEDFIRMTSEDIMEKYYCIQGDGSMFFVQRQDQAGIYYFGRYGAIFLGIFTQHMTARLIFRLSLLLCIAFFVADFGYGAFGTQFNYGALFAFFYAIFTLFKFAMSCSVTLLGLVLTNAKLFMYVSLELVNAIVFIVAFPYNGDFFWALALLTFKAAHYLIDARPKIRKFSWIVTSFISMLFYLVTLVILIISDVTKLNKTTIKLSHLHLYPPALLSQTCIIQIIIDVSKIVTSYNNNGFCFFASTFQEKDIDRNVAQSFLALIQTNNKARVMSSHKKIELEKQVMESHQSMKMHNLQDVREIAPKIGREGVDLVHNILHDEDVSLVLEKCDAWICAPSAITVDKMKVLGKGQFGIVHRCTYNDRRAAVKILKKIERKEIVNFIMECSEMINLQHPNLLRLLACHFSQDCFFLVTEIAENGTLQNCILSERLNLSLNNHLLNMLMGVCSGIQFLHSRDPPLMHRDIKPDNILVRDNYTTLLSDFGESKRLYNEERDRITTIVGTPYYIAPEILREEPSSLKSDVFSFGITALVVSTFYHYRMRLTREYCRLVNQDTIDPFRKRLDPVEFIFNYGQKERMKSVVTMKKVASGWRPKIPMPFQRHWPKLCKVIENCLLPSVEDRPTAKELMKQFKTITSCITGTEDDFLGVKTFPIRKYIFNRAMRILRHQGKCDELSQPGAYAIDLKSDRVEAFMMPNFENVFGNKGLNAGLHRKLERGFNAKDYFYYSMYTNNKWPLKCRKQLDPWISLMNLVIKLPYPLTKRYVENIEIEIYLDEKHYIYYCMPIHHITLHMNQFTELLTSVPTGWDRDLVKTKYVEAVLENISVISPRGLKHNENVQESECFTLSINRNLSLNGYVPQSPYIYAFGFKSAMNHKLKMIDMIEQDFHAKKCRFEARDSRKIWDDEVRAHDTEYLLPYWPTNTWSGLCEKRLLPHSEGVSDIDLGDLTAQRSFQSGDEGEVPKTDKKDILHLKSMERKQMNETGDKSEERRNSIHYKFDIKKDQQDMMSPEIMTRSSTTNA